MTTYASVLVVMLCFVVVGPVGAATISGQAAMYPNPFTGAAMSAGIDAGGCSGSIDNALRYDRPMHPDGGYARITGTGTAGWMQAVAIQPFTVGFMLTAQNVWTGFEGATAMPTDVKLGADIVDSWDGTKGVYPIHVQTFETPVTTDTLRIEFPSLGMLGTTGYGDFNKVVTIPDSFERIQPAVDSSAGHNWGDVRYLCDLNFANDRGWVVGTTGDRYVVFDLGGEQSVAAFMFFTYSNHAAKFDIQYGDGIGPWTTVAGVTMNTNESIPIKLNNPIATEKIKLNFTSVGASSALIEAVILVKTAGITEFKLADQATGNYRFTSTSTVDVSLQVSGAADGYKITESDVEPTAWDATPAATYTITGGQGVVTLHGWVRTSSGQVLHEVAEIVYNTNPTVFDVQFVNGAGDKVDIAWETDVDTWGRVLYMRVDDFDWTESQWEFAYGTSHSVQLSGLAPHADYLVKIQNNGKVEPEAAYNHLQFEPVTIDLITQVIGITGTTARSKMGAGNMVNLVGALDPAAPTAITQGEETDITLDLSDIVTSAYSYEMTVADRFLFGQTYMPILQDVTSHFVTYDLDAIRDAYSLTEAFKLSGIIGLSQDAGGMADLIWVIAVDGTEIFRSDLLTPTGVKTQRILQPGSTEEFVILPNQQFLTIASCDYDNFDWDWAGVGPLTITTVVESMIADFQLTDQSTGSGRVTNEDAVNVSISVLPGGGGTIEGYMIREIGDEPALEDPDWLAAAPAAYSIIGLEGPVTVYAWIKDSRGVVAGMTDTILFAPTDATAYDVAVAVLSPYDIRVSWTTDVLSYSRVGCKKAADADYTFTAWESSARTVHSTAIRGLQARTTYDIVLVNNEVTEAPVQYTFNGIDLILDAVGAIGTTGSSVMGDGNMVNFTGIVATDAPTTITQGLETNLAVDLSEIASGFGAEEFHVTDSMLQLQYERPILEVISSRFITYDLAAIRAQFGMNGAFRLAGRVGTRGGHGGANHQWVAFVDGQEWFRSAVIGPAPDYTVPIVRNVGGEGDIELPKSARFLTIAACDYDVVNEDYLGVGPLYLVPITIGPSVSVDTFTLSDQTSGSSLVTNSATVSVQVVASGSDGQDVTGYMITETAYEPDPADPNWLAAAPDGYTIAGEEGDVALYAWAKDADGNVGGASASILFSTATPAMSNVVITDNGDGTATATWTTDIPAEGSVNYGPVSLAGSTPNTVPQNAVGTSHSVSFPIAAGVNYKIILVNNEIASPALYWPKPWPVDGDTNGDCRVNILDLIFIRNKLNLDVASGDNWKADVNLDARINILDLIYVRNKLNTQCP